MRDGVVATVIWKTNPNLTDTCIETLRELFQVTRQRKGFRSVRLLRGAHDSHEFIMVEEWDSVEDHQDYMRYRTEAGDLDKLLLMNVGSMQLNYWMQSPLAETTSHQDIG